ncbi:hypothetical protein [Corallococcus macrosporus]|uniref:Uncharacterized protein n=1 Tax=Corallococcus macrosporus DSM 14697 TaxID=1189310 RepID=A0A250K451_9BACT|nr:hypothetical protein [Corallococcus macrosporus]ATB50527.1 hypothetical protein MYMAC_006183 [Corallococcus macrosporus DSM 14697]
MAASEERRFQALVLAPIRRVQRRLNAVAWAEAGVVPAWATATACVLARFLLRGAFVWALPPLLALGLGAWLWRARSRGVSLEHAAVLADRSANAGGLLLTRLERPVGEWELAVNQLAGAVKPPEVKWLRPGGALAGAVLFAAVGFLLPVPAPRSRPVNAAAAAKVAAVEARAEALAQEEVLEAAVEDELRRLAEEVAEGRFDAGDWEAADALEARLAGQAAEAAAQLARAAEAAGELEDALGAAGGAEAATREREALEQALMALEDGATGREAGADGEGARQQGGESNEAGNGDSARADAAGEGAQGAEGPRGSRSARSGEARAQARARASGSPDQIASLREALERRRQSLENRFDSSGRDRAGAQARRSRPGRDGAGQGRQGQGQSGREGADGAEGEGRPGEGQQGHASRNVRGGAGVSRGGGSQPLVFGGEAEMDPGRLAFEPLPPGRGGDEGEELWGLRAADPRRQAGPAGPGGAQGTQARGDAKAGPGAAPLLPRNRDMVRRYFGGESSGRGQ